MAWLRRDGGHMVDNPAAGIERNQEHSREVYLDPAQVALLREALAIYSTRRRGADAVADCIEFTLATGCRSGEAMTATWSQFDQALTTWTKPASTTKQKKLHRVPLGPAAQSILLRRRGLRQEGAEWVFPGRGGIGHARSLHNAWATVCGLAGLRSVRLHDLRHSYASLAISAGVPLQVVGGLLGHSSQQTTRRYAHLFDDDLRTAAGKVNAMIEGGGK